MKYSQLDLPADRSGQDRIYGVPSGYDAHVLLDLHSSAHRKIVYVCNDESHMRETSSSLAFISPDSTVLELPPWDCPPYSRISPNARIVANRIRTLARVSRSDDERSIILLTTPGAFMQMLAPGHVFSRSMYTVRVGRSVDSGKLTDYFDRIGLDRVPQVLEPGEFAVRGGIVDVFPPGYDNPVRLDFFGHTIESIREFGVGDQRTIRQLKGAVLTAASEIVLDRASIEQFRRNYRTEFGAASVGDQVYADVSAGQKFQGVEQWLPFFYRSCSSIFDYMPGATIVTGLDFRSRVQTWWDNVNALHDDRIRASMGRGKEAIHHACPPHKQYIAPEKLDELLQERAHFEFMSGPAPEEGNCVDGMGRTTVNLPLERRMGHDQLMHRFTDTIAKKREGGKIIIACRSDGSRDRLMTMLMDENIHDPVCIDSYRGFTRGKNSLGLALWPIAQGYEFPGTTVISEQDIFGSRKSYHRRGHRSGNATWIDDTELKPGELLVHLDHGIGRYIALQTHSIDGIERDFVVLEYAGNSRLSIPVENLDLLSRFGSDKAQLDRLGAASWQERRARLKKTLLDIASELIRVAAAREMERAPALIRDSHEWDSFVARFEYQETDDQEAAVSDLIADLESTRPMDRLVCGDVGYGKTEIAMRAAFIAVMAGYQVAVLTPTTLLSRQHHASFTRRFRGFPINIGQLSRLNSPADIKDTRAGLKDGKVDIVIGTHSLLGREIGFQNLGLMIVDEEQNFGVVQKERLKRLRTSVHILTLTATPIPRTLQQALSGIRDMSMIQTPPVDRLVIRTYVTPFDTVDIRQALLRELYRGGQSFVVVPRIKDMPAAEDFLKNSVPEASYAKANGRMSPARLEEETRKFYDGERNILLSTNIIASGLDIPTANTIVVINAYRFGLAQLYQLRGRVGRSHLRAYAYITYPGGHNLSPLAEARLKAINAIEDLGAGLRVSAQDLDIRGAGNMLGVQQSGHINEVGLELYNKMLEDAVIKLKTGEVGADGFPGDEDWTPQLNIGVEARIPDYYIPDTDVRIGIYRRMATLRTVSDIEEISVELTDRFGRMPHPLAMFIRMLAIKVKCKSAQISKLDWSEKEVVIRFHDNKFPEPEALMDYISSKKGGIRVHRTGLRIRRSWTSEKARVAGIYSIVRDLAALVH